MQCPKCGIDANPQAVYCHKCGTRIDGVGVDSTGAGFAPNVNRPNTATRHPSDALRPRPSDDNDDETELWQGRYSTRAVVPGLVVVNTLSLVAIVGAIWFGAGAAIWAIVIGAILLANLIHVGRHLYRRYSHRYRLTTQRLIHEEGLISRATYRIETIDMDDVSFTQGVVERVLVIGSIHITSSDRTHPDLWLRGIEDVAAVANQFDSARRRERMRRGLYIESV